MIGRRKILAILEQVEQLQQLTLGAEREHNSLLEQVHPDNYASARNLLHYLAVRSCDLRSLQNDLSDLAISSQSHAEAYTLNNLQKIGRLLKSLAGQEIADDDIESLDQNEGKKILKHNAARLFGQTSFAGQTKIMVTLPSEAAENYTLVHDLVMNGMHIARVNTAHDDIGSWELMIRNCKKAALETGHSLKIYMDLEGPKLRTGAIRTVLTQPGSVKKKPSILLGKGQHLQISRQPVEGYDGDPPVISLSLSGIFDFLEVGQSIWFDDGKLGGTILSIGEEGVLVEITHAPEHGFKLKAEKGVNFPLSKLSFPAFTLADQQLLPFIVAHADMVGLSFVQTAGDVDLLQQELTKLHREDIGIILKVETNCALQNLPSLLFKVMQSPRAGIMIARGDLAVELGLLRMAEAQEEIMWLAEAAHLPVVWATQVLETEAKTGLATRAEISDAVKATRAECAMLNKGPYILDALRTITGIDKQMAQHEEKKQKMLRALSIAKDFLKVG